MAWASVNLDKQRLLLLSLSVGVLVGACSKPAPPEKNTRLVVVENPRPYAGPGSVESFPGRLAARHEADLSFRIPGKLAERRVELGSRVKSGDIIAVLDPEDARLNLNAAKAALAAIEADVTLTETEEKRYRDLKAKGHVGQSAVDMRVNARLSAQARATQARAQLELAQNQSSYTSLRADADGVITKIFAEPGNVLMAGQPVVHFAQDGEREVRISVPEGRVDALKNAAELAIEIYEHPGKHYPAKLRDITPQADRATRTHEARVTLLNPEAATALGSSASVLALAESDGATFSLPSSALGALSESMPVVWKLQAGEPEKNGNGTETATPVPVQIIAYTQDSVIVSGGISSADQIISAGVHLLREGMPVRAIDRERPPAL